MAWKQDYSQLADECRQVAEELRVKLKAHPEGVELSLKEQARLIAILTATCEALR